uniref:RNase H type-1 domain-containing protein n=1 Tax=Quercus lobata TaxID=97700 RepID=A0A7N2M2D6_QUELO
MGIGVMVRDDQGCVAVDISNRINEPFGVVEVEAKAFEEGLLFTKDIGIQDFILEGDSLIIHKVLYGLSLAPTSMDSLTVAKNHKGQLTRAWSTIEASDISVLKAIIADTKEG